MILANSRLCSDRYKTAFVSFKRINIFGKFLLSEHLVGRLTVLSTCHCLFVAGLPLGVGTDICFSCGVSGV